MRYLLIDALKLILNLGKPLTAGLNLLSHLLASLRDGDFLFVQFIDAACILVNQEFALIDCIDNLGAPLSLLLALNRIPRYRIIKRALLLRKPCHLGANLLDLVIGGNAEHCQIAVLRTAGHSARLLHDIACKRDHPVLTDHLSGGIQVFHDDGSSEDIPEDDIVKRVVIEQIYGIIDNVAVLKRRQFGCAQFVERQEGCPSE